MQKAKVSGLVVIFLLVFSNTSCLKTRTGVKSNNDSSSSEDTRPTKVSNYDFEEMKNELARLNGRIEELNHSQKQQNTGDITADFKRASDRISELEQNQLLMMTEIKELKDQRSQSNAQSAKNAATPPKNLLQDGFALLAEKRFEDAQEKFKALDSRGIKGKDAAELHFGLGESEYGMKNWKKAIVEYSKVQESFGKSARIPSSLYKIGLSFQQLGMSKEAKGFFQDVVERYPGSTEATKAKLKLK